MQAPRVAKARGLSGETVLEQVRMHTEGRDLMILGEPRVNVLLLNRSLDVMPQSLHPRAGRENGPNAKERGAMTEDRANTFLR